MKYEVNECCDCATESYPCIGDSCSLRHVTYYKRDRCGRDGLTEDEIHGVDGEDLCDSCYDEEFSDDEDDSPCYECREVNRMNDLISRQAAIDMASTIQTDDSSGNEILDVVEVDDIKALPSAQPEQRWIPVSERVADFPCLACDIFGQIFIPSGLVVLNSRCYEGKDFAFNVEKFLRGKEVTLCGGEKVYLRPREIAAWMPLPEPYKTESEDEERELPKAPADTQQAGAS